MEGAFQTFWCLDPTLRDYVIGLHILKSPHMSLACFQVDNPQTGGLACLLSMVC